MLTILVVWPRSLLRVLAADEARIITPTQSSFETLSRFTELLDTLQKDYVQPSRVNTEWYTTVALRAFVRPSIPDKPTLLTPRRSDGEHRVQHGTG